MQRSNVFQSSVLAALLTALMACGGGGGDGAADPVSAPPAETPQADALSRFEVSEGVCSFDSSEAAALADLQYPVEFTGRCRVLVIGNKVDGKAWPAKSWPSTLDLS